MGKAGLALLGLLAGEMLPEAVFAETAHPPAYNWIGLYLGGHVGYAHGNANSTYFDPAAVNQNTSFGTMMGGFQGGYNHLLPSGLLLGVEADMSFPNFLETDDIVSRRATAQGEAAEKLDFTSTLRARIGYAQERWLLYTTGGLAFSQARFTETPGVIRDEDKALRQRTGWVAGAGVEYAISPEWSARFEYLYDRFAAAGANLPSGTRIESNTDLHMLRFGLNYQFGRANADNAPRTSMPSSVTGYDAWNIHAQLTSIGQGYIGFHSPYQGANSLSPNKQFKATHSATAYLGFRVWDGGEFYINPEMMQGFGLSDVTGIAGFPNGEAQKSNFPAPRLNIARAFLRQTFELGGEQETIADGPNQLAKKVDISRITVTAGKFAVPDIFNGNVYSSDPRTSFINWNMYGGGSYDWTMDKLSWTWGAVVDFNQKNWAFRTGYFLLPEVSNSNFYDRHAPEHGEYTAELELRYGVFSQPGKLRLFGWINHGIMGGYADALAPPLTSPGYPDIALTRRVRTNYGIVVNAEQAITKDVGIFSRASWSPGQAEIVGWTDVHASLSFGTVIKGTSWGRPDDKIGIAGLVESLSAEGQRYFAAGGLGIVIGDGQLNYSKERILETYYAYALNQWSWLTFDFQYIVNPAYNADRGPVPIYTVRLHAEF